MKEVADVAAGCLLGTVLSRIHRRLLVRNTERVRREQGQARHTRAQGITAHEEER